MMESFVDLTYRGLSLGKRVKLTQVRPSTGYLETPAPMPVGTAIQVATDDGVLFEALVMTVHEQVGGSERPPGMVVAPVFTKAAGDPYRDGLDPREWWKARVALPEEPPASTRVKPLTVRPRSHTVQAPPADPAPRAAEVVHAATLSEPDPIDGATVPMPVIQDDEPPGGRTTVMNAIDPDMLERLTRTSDEMPALRTTGEHDVVDDGKQTMMMDAVDPAALGLDVGSSGSMAAATDDEEDEPPKSPSGQPASGKKKKKKR